VAKFRIDKRALRDLVWEWDPIGIGNDRKYAEDEYDCILDGALSLLRRGAELAELVEHLNAELPEHFGLPPQPKEATLFAHRLTAWWEASRLSN
jgi:hypothetical protein